MRPRGELGRGTRTFGHDIVLAIFRHVAGGGGGLDALTSGVCISPKHRRSLHCLGSGRASFPGSRLKEAASYRRGLQGCGRFWRRRVQEGEERLRLLTVSAVGQHEARAEMGGGATVVPASGGVPHFPRGPAGGPRRGRRQDRRPTRGDVGDGCVEPTVRQICGATTTGASLIVYHRGWRRRRFLCNRTVWGEFATLGPDSAMVWHLGHSSTFSCFVGIASTFLF